MNILIDAFGGDNAPLEIIKGSLRSVDELDVNVTLVGDEEKIKSCAADNQLSLEKLAILHAPDVFQVCEEPKKILKEGASSSIAIGLKALAAHEGDAFVSAGSTGALAFGATFITKRIKGVRRAAILTVLPTIKGPLILLDSGANSECRPEMLAQFAYMGACYCETVLDIKKPRVALLNIGAEETKGRELEIEAYKLLSGMPLNFIGNVEARSLPLAECDVAVCDGYTGNIALKLYEGMGKFMVYQLRELFTKSIITKLGAVMVGGQLKSLKKRMDYKEYGGAVLAGVSAPVIKAHGSSDANAIFNAIRQAKLCVASDVTGKITAYINAERNASERN